MTVSPSLLFAKLWTMPKTNSKGKFVLVPLFSAASFKECL
jgi:hypothetical protein